MVRMVTLPVVLFHRILRKPTAIIKWTWPGARGVVKVMETGVGAMRVQGSRRWHGVS